MTNQNDDYQMAQIAEDNMEIFVDRSGSSDQVFAKLELEDIVIQAGIIDDDFNREKWEMELMRYNMNDIDEKQSFDDYHYDLVQDNGSMTFHLSPSAIEIFQKSNS